MKNSIKKRNIFRKGSIILNRTLLELDSTSKGLFFGDSKWWRSFIIGEIKEEDNYVIIRKIESHNNRVEIQLLKRYIISILYDDMLW